MSRDGSTWPKRMPRPRGRAKKAAAPPQALFSWPPGASLAGQGLGASRLDDDTLGPLHNHSRLASNRRCPHRERASHLAYVALPAWCGTERANASPELFAPELCLVAETRHCPSSASKQAMCGRTGAMNVCIQLRELLPSADEARGRGARKHCSEPFRKHARIFAEPRTRRLGEDRCLSLIKARGLQLGHAFIV